MQTITRLKYIRKETYPVDALLSLVEMHHTKKDVAVFDGDPIKLGSDRYKLFKMKGVCCVKCGLEGKFFAKERGLTKKEPKIISWHMNLYGINELGEEVLMTKDHIKPRVLGGPDHIDNYQPMCQVCNSEKGSQEI